MSGQTGRNFVPAQGNSFRLDIEGIDPVKCQQVDLPDLSVTVNKWSPDGVIAVKTPGMLECGDITINTLIAAGVEDLDRLSWLLANAYGTDRRRGTITRLLPNGADVEEWTILGAFPSKIGGVKFDKSKAELIVSGITLACTVCLPTDLAKQYGFV